jgi:hypothetical protein
MGFDQSDRAITPRDTEWFAKACENNALRMVAGELIGALRTAYLHPSEDTAALFKEAADKIDGQEAIIQAGADLLTEKQYEIDAFRAALTGLIHYAEQLELLVYAPEDRAEHRAMAAARAVIAKSENRRRFAAVDAAIALKGSGQ